MAGTTSKKVQIVRFDRELLTGFVNPSSYLTDAGVEMLSSAGSLLITPYSEVKTVVFVRDFDAGPMRKDFMSRPKLDGLWLQLLFQDGDTQQAVMPNNLLQVETRGFNLIPPETTQRIWVPRQALSSVQVLGVIGSPLAAAKKKKAPQKDQIGLFEQT